MDISTLKSRCKGIVAVPGDDNFKKFAYDTLWNKLIPDRLPQVIVRVTNEQDVIEAINFSRENKLKVTVRGGGHNWSQPSLRNRGMLIDLTELNKVISIDPVGLKAVLQPIISNRDAQKALNPLGVAFPSGHCPQVKLSGYLLGGGMSWNQGEWGHGADNVEAIELVTAEGKLITASKDENQDYFWAARGAGSGFFGVVTRYHLKLHPLPKAIHASSYSYSLDDMDSVAKWVREVAPALSQKVEFSLWVLEAPADLQEKCKTHNGKLCLVTATVFAETPEEAKLLLKPLDTCPVLNKCLAKSVADPMTFEQLFDISGSLWPENLRSRVEAVFSNAKLEDMFTAAGTFMVKAPSPITVFMFAVFTGSNVPAPLQDAAFSMTAKLYGGPWTMWKDEADDEANSAWHAECISLMKPHISGNYIGESDAVTYPIDATNAYSAKNWQKLADLRDKYDPDRVFFDYFDGLS